MAADIIPSAWEQGMEEQPPPRWHPLLLVTQGRPTEIKGSKTSCKILVKMLMVSGPLKPS